MFKFNPTVTQKPWGSEILWAHTPDYVGKILNITFNNSISIQYHNTKDETMYVLSGEGYINFYSIMEDGDVSVIKSIKVTSGDSVHIPAGKIHNVFAETDMVVLEASTDHLDDLVRIKDRYGRN